MRVFRERRNRSVSGARNFMGFLKNSILFLDIPIVLENWLFEFFLTMSKMWSFHHGKVSQWFQKSYQTVVLVILIACMMIVADV